MSNKEKTFVVYKHTCIVTNKSYVGITCDYERRNKDHQNKLSGCRAFSSAIKKYGWSEFSHEILATGLTLHSANHFESFYIKHFNSMTPNGYNLRTGGDVSLLNDEAKKKIGDANRGKNHPQFGKIGSESHKSKKYLVIMPSGDIEIINGLRDFCRKNGLRPESMHSVVSGRIKHHKGYRCEKYINGLYTDEQLNVISKEWAKEWYDHVPIKKGESSPFSKKHIIITPNGDAFVINGLTHFCRENGLEQSGLNAVSSGKVKHSKGHLCEKFVDGKYSEDEIKQKGIKWKKEWNDYKRPTKKGSDNKGSKVYFITNPYGEQFIIKGLNEFCRDNGLNSGRMFAVIRGDQLHHKGYKCEHYIEEKELEEAA